MTWSLLRGRQPEPANSLNVKAKRVTAVVSALPTQPIVDRVAATVHAHPITENRRRKAGSIATPVAAARRVMPVHSAATADPAIARQLADRLALIDSWAAA